MATIENSPGPAAPQPVEKRPTLDGLRFDWIVTVLSRRGVKPPALAVEIEAALPTGRETLDMIPFWVYHGIMNKQEHRFPVRFPLPLWEQLEQLAEEEERSINWEVIQAVRERLARKRPESKKPREQESV